MVENVDSPAPMLDYAAAGKRTSCTNGFMMSEDLLDFFWKSGNMGL
jgi:hypothetical protein